MINQLTNELRSTLNQPILENNYKLQTNINGEETEEFNYIFILTPERLMNLHTRKTKVILDDLFVDEAHKLAAGSSRDSERSLTEYNAIELTIEKFRELNVYFSSPNISNPSMFLKLFGKNPFFSKHVKEAPVSQNIFLADTQKKTLRVLVNNEFLSLNSELLRGINSNDDFILNVGKGKHSNMVYCSSASNAVHYAVNFANKINSTELSDEIKSAINSISQLVHEQYYLVKCLEKRIAYHHGKLPHSVRGIIEELFRNGEIDFMFCTPTLAEGVNMPIKNIFIICEDKIRYTDDKEKNKVKSLSFWNLAGRAGRYRSELCGNVFCLNSETKSWDNNLSIFRDKSVNLESTIEKNIKKKATVKQLEDFLKNKDADDLKVEEVIKHLANIICIETLKFPEEYNKSNTLNLFIKANLLQIIKLAKKRAKEIKHLPMELLNSYRTLSLNLHDDVFQVVKFHQDDSVLPPFGYDKCHEVLETFHELYNWGEREKITISQLGYYNNLIYRWVSGNSINSIIRSTINYYEKERKSLYIYKGNELLTPIFDGSVEHVNHIIEVVFDDIENKLRFKLERYFNHYHKALTSVLGEEKAGVNWAVFLEYGTQYPLVIEMQNLGLSRFTALNIYKNEALRKTLTLDAAKGGLQYNKKKLLSGFKEGSFEYKELSVLL
ncbi:hypothetical protein PCIT_a1079 [Pseudoalteromonas citrea]|uniref:Helicase C-terminal domain-containing protein n=1 Tax=Pseudoalteromonas citrea TaxID=43655 RepID=A0AAD4ALU2_9GAMM|nr:hypothetical protein PCIT_a1079 [Pseudoalteromonas citrea]